MKTIVYLAVVSLATGLIGCSQSPPLAYVSGTILINGIPVPGMEIEFQPDGRRPPSYAVTNEDGNFEAKFDRNRRGVVLGTHQVHIRPERVAMAAENASLQQAIKRSYHREPAKFAFPLDVSSGRNSLNLELKLENGELLVRRDPGTGDEH